MIDPFLKWAGGKRWLTGGRLPRPVDYVRYIEPFLGGAAVFFSLQPSAAVLSDINADLINLYQIMRDEPVRLQRMLCMHHAVHDPSHYYEARSWVPTCPIERAARMLYLNRTCWNGLYRVNKKNEFNVPIGTKSLVIGDNESFVEIAKLLNNAEIVCRDFEVSIDIATEGDFLFVDPPYTVKHNNNGFVKYNENIFSWSDQVRLARAVGRAIDRGASVVVTNADHESVIELYQDIADYSSFERSSVLASSASRRGRTSEAIFSANLT